MTDSRTWKLATLLALVAVGLPLAIWSWTQVSRDWARCSIVSRHVAQGDAAFKEGDFGAAAVQYARARAMDPMDKDVASRLARARVFHMAWNPDGLRNADMEDVLADARFVEKSFPADAATALALQGFALAGQGRTPAATELYRKALAADPANGPAHLGQALLRRSSGGKPEEVLADLREAVKSRPNAAEIQALLGRALQEQGDAKGAIEAFQAALQVREDGSWHYELGSAQMAAGDLAASVTHLTRATQLNPQLADAWSMLGQALMATKKPQEAEASLRRAMAIQPTVVTQIRLATALNRMNRFRESLPILQQLASQNPNDMMVLFELAAATEGTGQPENALRVYAALLQMPQPEDEQLGRLLEQFQKVARERSQALMAGATAPQQNAPKK